MKSNFVTRFNPLGGFAAGGEVIQFLRFRLIKLVHDLVVNGEVIQFYLNHTERVTEVGSLIGGFTIRDYAVHYVISVE